nr:3-oxoacyl-ACP reductase family protein [Streptomyces sp. SID14478]
MVTGGSTGIGWAVTQELSRLGAHIAVNHPPASSPPALDALPTPCMTVEADISDRRQVAAMFEAIRRELPPLDILVNNAGIFPRAAVLDLDEATWDRVMGVNLKGSFFCAQEAAAVMIANGGGRIINVASSAALTGSPRGAHYAASKAGLIGLGKSLARALAEHNITVNTVAPGVTETSQPGLTEQQFREKGSRIPLGRVARPQDVARAVAFLASEDSDYITGQTLSVNGGSVMVP